MATADRSRPTLLGTAPSPASSPTSPQDFQFSILDALNAPEAAVPGRTHRPRRRWVQAAVAAVGLAAAASTAVLLWARLQAAPAGQPDTLEPPQAALPAAASASGTHIAQVPSVMQANPAAFAVSAAPAEPTVATQAARIEDVAASSPGGGAVRSEAPTSPFDKLAALEPAPPPSAAKAERTKPPEPSAAKGRDTKLRDASARQTQAQATGKAGTAVRTAANASPGGASKAAPARGRAAQAGTEADADVEIMTALMNHMNESAAANAASTEASIADLVRRCRALPAAEAQACRRRICQGYWGRAEACPAPRERSPSSRTVG